MSDPSARICAYCGEPATTDDHVVARSLLVDATTPVIVPACDCCNNAKSRDDDYLRDVFAIRIETATLPEMKGKAEKMERSALREGRRSPGNTMLRTFSKTPIISKSGDLLGFAPTVGARAERIHAGLKWIVRGLYFHHQKQVLDPSYTYELYAYRGADNKEKFDAIWPNSGSNGPYSVGGCLTYKVSLCADVPDFSNWLLVFYNRLFFIISVNEESLRQRGKEHGIEI